MRVPEPGSRQLLLEVRRAARQGGTRRRDDAGVHARGRDRLPKARHPDRARRLVLHPGRGQPQRHLPEPSPDRIRPARGRRRGPDRQVPAHLPEPMSATTETKRADEPLTIGTVCSRLQGEFPDISISKIRYLEDQGLLKPRRTRGGYRLFDEDDVERLRTILRLQRDEFLPLRVIQQELATPSGKLRRRRRPIGLTEEDELPLAELCKRAGIGEEVARELEEFGLLEPRGSGKEKRYGESDVEIAGACAKLARFGIAPRNLRRFRTSAGQEASVVEQLVGPALRSRNPERRKAGMEDLQSLASLAQELSQLLFWRDLRHVARR